MTKKKSLVCKNGRFYENGKMLRKQDYAECYSAHEPNYILSFLTGCKYRLCKVDYQC